MSWLADTRRTTRGNRNITRALALFDELHLRRWRVHREDV